MSKRQYWQRDVSPAAWLRDALGPGFRDVCSFVPGGLPGYARILHPAGGHEPPGGEPRRWADIARENGRVPHATMQFHNIVRPRGEPSADPGDMPATGVLPLAERELLVDLLAAETSTPDACWFCMWDGWGGLDDQGVSARVQLPGRAYLLYHGPVSAALSVPPLAYDRAGVGTFTPRGSRPPPIARAAQGRALADLWYGGPAVWWPEDRGWVVATEIDFAWTYVGASERAIERLLAHPGLEVWPAQPSDPFSAHSDAVNAALDAPG